MLNLGVPFSPHPPTCGQPLFFFFPNLALKSLESLLMMNSKCSWSFQALRTMFLSSLQLNMLKYGFSNPGRVHFEILSKS